ncbi:MAG: ArsA family ATPase [Candidatus Njordarchaeota archaeon]
MGSLIDELSKKSFIIVSGKGGVGKTTFASALGFRLAEKKNKKVLVVSIDPAHSLGDIFSTEIGSKITELARRLYGLEFDPVKIFATERDMLIKALSSGSGMDLQALPVDDEMIDFLLDMQLPYEFAEGIGFMKLFYGLIEKKEYDIVIFDTAPTGHTLELLKLPEFLESFYGKMIRFRLKMSRIFSRIKALFGFTTDDKADIALRALEETKKEIEIVRKILMEEKKTEFVVVMIPNEMSILESLRLIGELEVHEIPNKNVVVNFVRIYSGECSFCNSLSQYHHRQLLKIKEKIGDKNLWVLPYLSEEIRGIKSLQKIADHIGRLTIGQAIDLISSRETIE